MPRTIFTGAAVGLVLITLAVVVLRASSILTPSSPAASQSQDEPITICHRTGSADNPWVFMTVDVTTWSEHQAQGDVRASSLAECLALATPASAPAVAAVPSDGPIAQVQAPTSTADVRPVAAATAASTAVATVEVAGAAATVAETPPEVATLPASGGEPDRPALVLALLGLGALGLGLRRWARRRRQRWARVR
jgi:hypothetical protein